jgi:hypothetical protein
MRKYIGTSTISKKMKKTNRSRLRNEPMTPAWSSSSHARYGFSSWCGSLAKTANGNRIPVRTTSSSEMPSTPRCHEMPQRSIHVCFDTYWNPDEPSGIGPDSNDATSQMLIAAVVIIEMSAISLTRSGRRELEIATATAPATGTRISNVRIGNDEVAPCIRPPPASWAVGRSRFPFGNRVAQ